IDAGTFNPSYSVDNNSANSLQNGSTGLDSSTKTGDNQAILVSTLLNQYSNNDGSPSSQRVDTNAQNASQTIQQDAPQGQVDKVLNTPTNPTGTLASIGQGATVQAGLGNGSGGINVIGREDVKFTALTGSISAGVVGIGGAIVVATIQAQAQAQVLSNV